MPFTSMQAAADLATKIDTAMNRRDEIGMDMLRDLLPELRDMIDEINAALREVDELLFLGLRDEALTLNDPDFPRVAARLNLEDKSAWPEALAFFEREGIAPPPALDFETLAALESAHAELETMGQPLDRLRRLVLERTPLLTRLAVLRRLRDADGTKPVWAETIIDHERARLAEVPEAVKRAMAAKDAAAIAELHAELVDPEWSTPVPRDLVKATRGADLWARLRETVPSAEQAATAMGACMAAVTAEDPTAVTALRQARQAWYEASGAVQECLTGLAECPTVAALARGDGLEARFAALGPVLEPALGWLAAKDAEEAAAARRDQAIAQLESYVDHPPAAVHEEAQWLAGVAHLERELADWVPEELRARVAAAQTAVRGRPARRALIKGGIGVAVAAVVLGLAFLVNGCLTARRLRLDAIESLEEELGAARSGVYGEVPNAVAEAQGRYPADDAVRALVTKIDSIVGQEANRRAVVRDALDEQARELDDAERELQRRSAGGAVTPEPWPDTVTTAARAWRRGRAAGGLPSNREGSEPASAVSDGRAAAVLREEEELINAGRERQERVESRFGSQSKSVFLDGVETLRQAIAELGTSADPQAVRGISEKLEMLRSAALVDKTADTEALLSTARSKTLVPQGLLNALDGLGRDLDKYRAPVAEDLARGAP